jgi:hypothetical protein
MGNGITSDIFGYYKKLDSQFIQEIINCEEFQQVIFPCNMVPSNGVEIKDWVLVLDGGKVITGDEKGKIDKQNATTNNKIHQ